MRSPGMTAALLPIAVLLLLSTALSAYAVEADPPASAYLPMAYGPAPAKVVIAAAHIDSAVSYEPDEAFALWNTGYGVQPLAGWQVVANSSTATFPLTSTLILGPGQQIWCSASAGAFFNSFGFLPDCQWAVASDPEIASLDGRLSLANAGGNLMLLNDAGKMADALTYGNEEHPIDTWIGLPAQAYTRGAIGATGQIWTRKLDPDSGQPMDTDGPADWDGDLADPRWGRRVHMPGWRIDAAAPIVGRNQAMVSVAVGPEGLFQPIATALGSATERIDLSLYTLEHPVLTQILVQAVDRGVRVRLLLEGGPAGGISDLQKWCVDQLASAGAEVRYLAPGPDAPNGYRARFSFLHAKYAIIDGRLAFNGTENFTLDAMPLPGPGPIGGRRGFYLFTDAALVVTEVQTIFDHDWSPDRFLDLYPFDRDHARYGGPPADFVMPDPPHLPVEEAPFGEPVVTTGEATFGVISAPENALHPDAGLMALLAEAGAGDELLAWQLYEHRHWGEANSNPVADPNPRLQALIDAARRGARVRILLDSFFDESTGLRTNRTTAAYLLAVAESEGLDMKIRMGNPTGGGIHAKTFLLQIAGRSWAAVGSLNGGEVSHKLNREVVVLTDAPEIYSRLADVFAWDWERSPSW